MIQGIGMHPLEPLAFTAFFGFYFLAFTLFTLYTITGKDWAGRIAVLMLGAGLCAHTVNLAARGMMAGRVPFSNLYESLLVIMWGIAFCLAGMMIRWRIYAAGTAIMPLVLIMAFYATTVNKAIVPLMPALRSNWIIWHVAAAAIAYGAFTLSFGLALLYLAKDCVRWYRVSQTILDLCTLDMMICRAITFGFPFLVILIITGALWAEKAWGDYWSWDPKETWSLVTLLFYASYLHARRLQEWQGRPAVLLAAAAFICLVFCYMGVNLVLPGLHSYGSR